MRINKYLTTANYCSRREADRLIEAGRVKINGDLAKLGDQVTYEDRVEADGRPVRIDSIKSYYLAYYKPFGVITTTDTSYNNNIIEAVDFPERIYPIGRLDVASEGLILLTNDGEVVNKILKSENEVDKEYLVTVDKEISKIHLDKLAEGVDINGYTTKPAQIEQVSANSFIITIVEGKNRQIRKMCESVGYKVSKLKRLRIGEIKLGKLIPGEYRIIDEKNFKNLLNLEG